MDTSVVELVCRFLVQTTKFSISLDPAAIINAIALLLAIHRFITSRKAKKKDEVTEIEIAGIKFREGDDF